MNPSAVSWGSERPDHPGRWWTRRGDRVVCELCPRRCHLKPGQRGFCYVRAGSDDGVALLTWGRTSGFCVDPIEKKPLFHFLPGTPVLSFGTAGCNLGCRFCQNWHISKAREDNRLHKLATPEAIADAGGWSGSRAVAFTYNDPVIFAEFALDVAEACRAKGLKTVAVTAGYITERAREEFFRGMDAANVDLKAFSERFYRELCYGELEPVKDTLRWLVRDRRTWTEITTLLIPGENDSEAEIRALARFVREELSPEVPVHFTAYHPDFKVTKPRTPAATLERARQIARDEGLQFVYTGNVRTPDGENTRCPGCDRVLIGRSGYEIVEWGLDGARCATCDHAIAGVFEPAPGTWGNRRQPIQLQPKHTGSP